MISKAMILAAGYGKRLAPFTNHTPKPLLSVRGQTLIDRHLQSMRSVGIKEVIINVAHLQDKIVEHCHDGSKWGLKIEYSREDENAPLETGGGVEKILPWFDNQAFLLVAADIWTEFSFKSLLNVSTELVDAHAVIAPKPMWLANGDFAIDANSKLTVDTKSNFTFAGLSVLHPRLWGTKIGGAYPLSKVLTKAAHEKKLGGLVLNDAWFNIGCKNRLEELCKYLRIDINHTNYIT